MMDSFDGLFISPFFRSLYIFFVEKELLLAFFIFAPSLKFVLFCFLTSSHRVLLLPSLVINLGIRDPSTVPARRNCLHSQHGTRVEYF
jgi:hypothetical protein